MVSRFLNAALSSLNCPKRKDLSIKVQQQCNAKNIYVKNPLEIFQMQLNLVDNLGLSRTEDCNQSAERRINNKARMTFISY